MEASLDRTLESGSAKQCIEVKNKYVPLFQFGYNELHEGFPRSFFRPGLHRTLRVFVGPG